METTREAILLDIKRRCAQNNTNLLLSVYLIDNTYKQIKVSVPADTTGLVSKLVNVMC